MKDKIKAIIKKEFGAKVEKITRITEGYSHFMYLVEINETPREVIIRFSNNTKPNVSLLKEKFIIETLRKNKIPVPKIYAFYFPENKKEGYMIMEKLEGESLDSVWNTLKKEDKLLMTKKMGKLLANLHKIKFEKFGIIKEDGITGDGETFKFRSMGEEIKTNPCQRDYMKQILHDFAILSTYDHISKEFLSKYLKYIIENKNLLKYEGEPCLIHSDFYPGHVFVKKIKGEYKIIGIIDFELARAGCPESEFIKLHRFGFFEIPELAKALQEGYVLKIDKDKVCFQRILRDCIFATYILESGNMDLSKKVLEDVEREIDEKNNQIKLTFFTFP